MVPTPWKGGFNGFAHGGEELLGGGLAICVLAFQRVQVRLKRGHLGHDSLLFG